MLLSIVKNPLSKVSINLNFRSDEVFLKNEILFLREVYIRSETN